jgi:hypothetical protein
MKVFPTYRENFTKFNIEKDWWSRVVSLSEKYGMNAYDFNKIGNCELYYDASHQSAFCYYEYIHYLIDEMEK